MGITHVECGVWIRLLRLSFYIFAPSIMAELYIYSGGIDLPYKAKRPCLNSQCTRLVHGAYCDEHKPKDTRPGIYNRKGYGPEWKQIRNRYLLSHPKCERCGDPSSQVHHKRGVAKGHDEKNLEALCQRCHSRETASKGRGDANLWG